jgi:hypothetical protein
MNNDIVVKTPFTNKNIAKEEVALVKLNGRKWGVEVRWTGQP